MARGPQEGPGRGREHVPGERRAWGSFPPQPPHPPLEPHAAHPGRHPGPRPTGGGGPVVIRALLPCSPSSGCMRPPGAPARRRPESRPTPLPLRDPSPHLSACPEPSPGAAPGQPPPRPLAKRDRWPRAPSHPQNKGGCRDSHGGSRQAPTRLCPRTPSPGTPDRVRRAAGRDDREHPACPPPCL